MQLYLILLLFAQEKFGNLQLQAKFEASPAVDLIDPYSIAFMPQGNYYVLDRGSQRIHIYDQNRHFLRSFGAKGQGPGEFLSPVRVTVSGDKVIVQDHIGRHLSIFDTKGTFLKNLQIGEQVHNYTPLSAEEVFYVYPSLTKKNTASWTFARSKNNQDVPLKEFESHSFPKPMHANAFRGNPELQQLTSGEILFGYSEDKTLYVYKNGQVFKKKEYELRQAPPSEKEGAMLKKMNLHSIGGDFPYVGGRTTILFDQPKAFYTHFTVKKDKIAFVLTPIGGIFGGGLGHAWGDYQICDFKTGKLLSRGHYELPDYSYVLYVKDQIFAFVCRNDGMWDIYVATLEGL